MTRSLVLLLVFGVADASHSVLAPPPVAAGGNQWRLPTHSSVSLAPGEASVVEGATWLVKHMQWDFDDIDPVFPLSPFFRFEHKVDLPWKGLTEEKQSVTLTTTVHPTRPHASVATSYPILPWVMLQGSLGTAVQNPLKGVLKRAGMELSLPLEKVTDPALNNALDRAQDLLIGSEEPHLVREVKSKMVVGFGTTQEPTVGVASTVVFGQKKGGFAGIRTRVSTTRHGSVSYSLSAF